MNANFFIKFSKACISRASQRELEPSSHNELSSPGFLSAHSSILDAAEPRSLMNNVNGCNFNVKLSVVENPDHSRSSRGSHAESNMGSSYGSSQVDALSMNPFSTAGEEIGEDYWPLF